MLKVVMCSFLRMIVILCYSTCATWLRVVELKHWSPRRKTGNHTAAVAQGLISLEADNTHTCIKAES